MARRRSNPLEIRTGDRLGAGCKVYECVQRDRSGHGLFRNELTGSRDWMRLSFMEGMLAAGQLVRLPRANKAVSM